MSENESVRLRAAASLFSYRAVQPSPDAEDPPLASLADVGRAWLRGLAALDQQGSTRYPAPDVALPPERHPLRAAVASISTSPRLTCLLGTRRDRVCPTNPSLAARPWNRFNMGSDALGATAEQCRSTCSCPIFRRRRRA
jgi:hypothetical protein